MNDFLKFLAKELYDDNGSARVLGYFTDMRCGDYDFESLTEDEIYEILLKSYEKYALVCPQASNLQEG